MTLKITPVTRSLEAANWQPMVQGKEREEWSVLGIDFRTGELVYRLPLFRGEHRTHYDNAWATDQSRAQPRVVSRDVERVFALRRVGVSIVRHL